MFLDNSGKDLRLELMPLIKIHYCHKINPSDIESLSSSLVSHVASTLDKSEDFVMVIFQQTNFQSFGYNSIKPSIYTEFKNVGDLSPEITHCLPSLITELFVKTIKLDPTRLYIEFQSAERHRWGWNGKTFYIPE